MRLSFDSDDMRPEYDFKNMKGGVRGKYYKAYREGHSVEIHKTDKTTVVQYCSTVGCAVRTKTAVNYQLSTIN